MITGAGGFVAHHFVEHVLVNTDWNLLLTDSFRHKGKTDRLSEVLESHSMDRSRVQVITHDLNAPFSVQTMLRLPPVDFMVCFASESHVDRSIEDPVPFVRNNVEIALNSLELARDIQPHNLIWISTDEVYGPITADDEHGHPEWAPILPSNPYAGSKAAQEAIAVSYWRTYGVPLQIVNCMNMIGERQSAEKYLPMTISRVLKGDTVTIHGTPGNIGSRYYLHARNLADGIMTLLQTQPTRFGSNSYDGGVLRPDRYNIVPPDRLDNLELAQMVAEYVGRPLKYELLDFHTTRPGHDPHYGLDGSKMFNELDWVPPVPLEKSLERTVRWSVNHPEWLTL
jgi:dTDP-glucose 4,6-dehydratase